MTLAAFRAHEFARTGQAKSLGSRLVGLELGFAASFCFARHSCLLLSDKINREIYGYPADINIVGLAHAPGVALGDSILGLPS